ncbi:SDR family NAD(P)-dependent oxidoreductase [Luteibacter sp.]|uniref:SDR family NAD(P)-dependent oxidoreductase n=1 Tax=Luteibacter sp. TaxID=1886636 RepID=UPI003F7FB32E
MKTYMCIGAGRGIGLATARRFAREGYRIVLVSRSAADNDRLRAMLGNDIADVRFESADATDPAQLGDVLERYAGTGIDVIHYNAAAMRYDPSGALVGAPIDAQGSAEITSDIAVNVATPLATLAKVLPSMEARGTGTILLTGGGFAVEPSADFLTLSVGKAALRTAAQALFEPLKQRGVHIATVRVSTLVASDPGHPAKIADEFWALHAQPPEAWTWESIYPRAA